MKLFKWSVVLLALLLAAMTMVPMVSASEQSSSNQLVAPNQVGIKEAESIALFNARDLATASPDFAEWSNAKVSLSKTYYDLNDQVTAYAYDVIVNGSYAGYILVSATTDKYPVLEISKGKLPGYNSAKTLESEQSVKNFASEKGLTISESRPVYLGPLSYYRKYSMVNQNGIKGPDTFVDEHTDSVVDLSNKSTNDQFTMDKKQFGKIHADKKADIKVQWDKQRILLSSTNFDQRTALTNSIQTTSSSNYVYDVPLFIQDSSHVGCSPMASSMVVSYWSTHGYSALPSARNTLFPLLASAMGTSNWPQPGTTWPWDIDDGINTVFYSYAQRSPATNDYLPGWSGFVSEINAGRPFVLSMHNGGISVGGTQAYGDHSVAVAGYVSSTFNYITIHDTWDGSNVHLLKDNSWDNIMVTWVRP